MVDTVLISDRPPMVSFWPLCWVEWIGRLCAVEIRGRNSHSVAEW